MADVPQPWGLKKTLKFTVPLVAVGLLVVYAYLPHDKQLKLSKVKGNECIVMPKSSVVRNLQQRECDRTHDGEVYAFFKYPGSTIAGEPSPEENCSRVPDGLTEQDAAYYQRFIDLIDATGKPLALLSNNEDQTADRDYACVLVTPDQKGHLLQELATQAGQPTATTGG